MSKEAFEAFQARPSSEWMFTINNYTNDDIHKLFSMPMEWKWIAGKEIAPSTKTPHLQGLLWGDKEISRKEAEELLGGRAWLERPLSFENALGYTLKEGKVITNTVVDLPHFLSQLSIYLHFNNTCTEWLYNFYRDYTFPLSLHKPPNTFTLPEVANFWDLHAFNHDHYPYSPDSFK